MKYLHIKRNLALFMTAAMVMTGKPVIAGAQEYEGGEVLAETADVDFSGKAESSEKVADFSEESAGSTKLFNSIAPPIAASNTTPASLQNDAGRNNPDHFASSIAAKKQPAPVPLRIQAARTGIRMPLMP